MLALLFLAPAALAFGGGPKRPRGLALRAGSAAVEERAPALTLYRDTNGWCPFCERVWVALEKKGIPSTAAFAKALGASAGPRRAGLVPADLSARDLELVPTMERFYYQLRVLKPDFPPLDAGRPGLEAWFAAMDAEPASGARQGRRVLVDGRDELVPPHLPQGRPGDGGQGRGGRRRGRGHARRCVGDAGARGTPAVAEARAKLAANRAAVARDAADPEPKTQPGVPRAAAVASRAPSAALDDAGAAPRRARAASAARPRSTTTPASPRRPSRRACAPRDAVAPAARAAPRSLKRA
ncbi:glutathione transferase [Aureococcus anophagefferens]|nr:glutathione transferase [Aureococcus anophagefferens]